MTNLDTDFLIVGAGPFGLAMAAQAQALGVNHMVVGEPMSFWKRHMPAGMLLRSACDWHLDPTGHDTIVRFLATRDQTPAEAEPLSLGCYLEYAEWFRKARGIDVRPLHVTRLDSVEDRLRATCDDGTIVTAGRVLLALGFAAFAHVPSELAAIVPAAYSSHTCDCETPARFAGRRVLVVGGRQSAFESAALLAEAGATAVHVCHRHDTPAFATSDWSWVEPLLQRIAGEPGWYRDLPEPERKALNDRFWEEGRLKLEPWLGPRVRHEAITIRARTRIVSAAPTGTALRVRLDGGDTVEVDHVLYATGYKADLRRVPLLSAGNLLDRIECRDGSPVLDEGMQTTVPGLFVTSLPAARDFGLFFAFTAAVRASAHIVGRALRPGGCDPALAEGNRRGSA
jgi:thioredoxin reductase